MAYLKEQKLLSNIGNLEKKLQPQRLEESTKSTKKD